jgi:hypothetical protein
MFEWKAHTFAKVPALRAVKRHDLQAAIVSGPDDTQPPITRASHVCQIEIAFVDGSAPLLHFDGVIRSAATIHNAVQVTLMPICWRTAVRQ